MSQRRFLETCLGVAVAQEVQWVVQWSEGRWFNSSKLCERDGWAGAAPWKCKSIYLSVFSKLFMLSIFHESNVSSLLNMLKFKHHSENISINEAQGIEIYAGICRLCTWFLLSLPINILSIKIHLPYKPLYIKTYRLSIEIRWLRSEEACYYKVSIFHDIPAHSETPPYRIFKHLMRQIVSGFA